MYCLNPKCSCVDHRVLESRSFLNGHVVRRKRECLSCSSQFITYEITENDLISKKVMHDFYARLGLEIKTQITNKIEKIKKELDSVSYQLFNIKDFFSLKIK